MNWDEFVLVSSTCSRSKISNFIEKQIIQIRSVFFKLMNWKRFSLSTSIMQWSWALCVVKRFQKIRKIRKYVITQMIFLIEKKFFVFAIIFNDSSRDLFAFLRQWFLSNLIQIIDNSRNDYFDTKSSIISFSFFSSMNYCARFLIRLNYKVISMKSNQNFNNRLLRTYIFSFFLRVLSRIHVVENWEWR